MLALQEQLTAAINAGDEAAILLAAQNIDQYSESLKLAMRTTFTSASSLAIDANVAQFAQSGIGFDFNLVHRAAADWARNESPKIIGSMNQFTGGELYDAMLEWFQAGKSIRELTDAVADWIESGKPLPELIDRLTPVFGHARAELIATTEVTRAYAEGNLQSWNQIQRETGLTIVKQVTTANDEKVCPICAPLGGLIFSPDGALPQSAEYQEQNGVQAGLNDPFVHPGGSGAAAGFKGTTYNAPPFHPRCRCDMISIVV